MNVCGEGGEYESFTLDCPLYKKKIRIDEFEIVHHDPNVLSPVAYMKIKNVTLVEK